MLARSSFAASALGPDAPPVEGLLAGLARSGAGMVAGMRHLSRQRGAAYALLAQAAHRLLFGILALATLLLYRNYFAHGRDIGGSISGLGAVFAAGGVGALVAAFLTPPVTRRIGGWRWIVVLLGFEGVAVLVCGLPFRADLLVLAVFFVNLASQGIKIVVDTDLQHECADEFRGRVFSINDTAFNVLFVIGLFIGALVLPDNGRSIAVLAAVAAGYPVIATWYGVVGGRWARRVGDDIAKPAEASATVAV
jgi:MFS family permease